MKRETLLLTVLMLLTVLVGKAAEEIDGIYYNLDLDNNTAEVTKSTTQYTGSITIPEKVVYDRVEYSVNTIGVDAFRGCVDLSYVYLPEGITRISSTAFTDSGIKSILIPSSVTSIGFAAFSGCDNLETIKVAEGNPVFDSRENCNAIIETETNKLIRGGLNTIIPQSVTIIGNRSFEGCRRLLRFVIPSNITHIEDVAFASCPSLSELIISDGVTYIGSDAFSWCTSLKTITIPKSVKTIKDGALGANENLTEILSMINEPMAVTLGGGCWEGINLDEITLYVPKGTKGLYQATEGWNVFKNITEVFNVDGIHYTVTSPDEMTVEVTSGGSYEGDVVIPEKVEFGGNEFSVTSIGEEAFCGCRGLTSIVIPEGVTSIGGYAFKFCSGLTSFAIPESVTSIGDDAFSECSGLTSITIPEGLTSIGDYAFWACSNLTSIVVDAGNTAYTSANGSNAIIEKATNTLIRGCANTIIPEDVTSIGGGAFTNSSGLTSITIPKGVTSICHHAFAGCSDLTSITILEGVTRIGEQAFIDAGLTSVTLPNSLEIIEYGAFQGCYGLTSMFVPKSVTFIDPTAFGGGNISSITVEDGNPVYDSRDNCNAVITTATNELLISCNNTIIPKTITRIASHGLAGYSDTASIVIPAGVTYIGHRAFWGHYNLTVLLSMIKEPMVVTFDGGCWEGINPDDITLYVPKGTKELYEAAEGWNVFKNISEVFEVDGINYTVTSPDEMTVEVTGGGSYEGDVVVPEKVAFGGNEFSVTSIGCGAFLYCTNLTSITIPFGVTKIDDVAFQGCFSLTSITIPESVTNIGCFAFEYCFDLTNIIIPNSVANIGEGAFAHCPGPTSINIPEDLTRIGVNEIRNPFYGCSGLMSIVVDEGNTVYTSANDANVIIEKESNLLITGCKNTIIPDGVTRIGRYAFADCPDLTSITIPEGVISIDDRAFSGCTGLTSITIPNSVTSIGGAAFAVCTGLTSITIPNSVTSIGGMEFLQQKFPSTCQREQSNYIRRQKAGACLRTS